MKDKLTFLKEFLRHRGISQPIIVSPSMSGQFALPYLMTPAKTCADRASGFLAIAPVGTEKYADAIYHRCEVRTENKYNHLKELHVIKVPKLTIVQSHLYIHT